MPVTITPTRYAVEVPESAWEERSPRLPLNLERWKNGRWYLVEPLGQLVYLRDGVAGKGGLPLDEISWPTYADAHEALERHLAAGGKLP